MQASIGNKMNRFINFSQLMEKNWPSAFETLFLLFPRLGKISNCVEGYIEKLMEDQGLLASDFHLITAIRRATAQTPFELKPSELCNYMLFSWGGITKVMKRLEEKGIITRVSNDHDKRIRMIRLTKLGEDITEKAALELQAFHKELLTGFTAEEVAVLDKLLAKLLDNVEEYQEVSEKQK